MQTVDPKKLAAVCALLEGPKPMHFRHYLALGADPYILSQNHDQIAGVGAAVFVRELASRLKEQLVDFGVAQVPVLSQLLDQQPKQLAVGVGLYGRHLAQCVEGAPPNV